jgi:hypothetical protein
VQAFGNFFESLRAMMEEAADWKPGAPFEPALTRFLDELFPQMEERNRFADIFRSFESKKLEGINITLKEVAFIKLFCDAYFLRTIRPSAVRSKLGVDVKSSPRADDASN